VVRQTVVPVARRYEKSPLGGAAALATLDVIEKEGLVARARDMGRVTLKRLAALAGGSPILGKVRGLGMYWGAEIEPWAGRPPAEVADHLLYACIERGLSFKIGVATWSLFARPLPSVRTSWTVRWGSWGQRPQVGPNA